MTATDELRRQLDERGVEWRKTPHYSSESQDNETVFEGTGIEWYANDHLNGRLGLRTARYEVTPEQAIAATLGVDLKAENAKLRELVRDAWGNGHPDRSCGDCDIRDECHDDIERLRKDGMSIFSRCLFELRIEERMRELRIEVDG